MTTKKPSSKESPVMNCSKEEIDAMLGSSYALFTEVLPIAVMHEDILLSALKQALTEKDYIVALGFCAALEILKNRDLKEDSCHLN